MSSYEEPPTSAPEEPPTSAPEEPPTLPPEEPPTLPPEEPSVDTPYYKMLGSYTDGGSTGDIVDYSTAQYQCNYPVDFVKIPAMKPNPLPMSWDFISTTSQKNVCSNYVPTLEADANYMMPTLERRKYTMLIGPLDTYMKKPTFFALPIRSLGGRFGIPSYNVFMKNSDGSHTQIINIDETTMKNGVDTDSVIFLVIDKHNNVTVWGAPPADY